MPDPERKSPHVGVLLYTHDRVDDARISMEIIRNVWPTSPLFEHVAIVHAFNGEESWWPEPYLEDELCRTENPGHFAGAELLLNTGMQVFMEKYPDITHVIILAADTWCVKPHYIENVIQTMAKNEQYLATCAWGSKKDTNMFNIGMALDLCVVDMAFARGSAFFPLRYGAFVAAYGELLMYQGSNAYLERVFALRFKQAVARSVPIPSENLLEKIALAHVCQLRQREPVHYEEHSWFNKSVGRRTMYWPAIGLVTHHDPHEKRRVFKKWRLALGEHGKRFVEAKDLSYFNQGKKLTEFKKGNTTLNYND